MKTTFLPYIIILSLITQSVYAWVAAGRGVRVGHPGVGYGYGYRGYGADRIIVRSPIERVNNPVIIEPVIISPRKIIIVDNYIND